MITTSAAPVGWVRRALDVAAALQSIDEVAHRLVRHLGALGENADPRATALQVLEDRRVGRPQIFEALGGKPREKLIQEGSDSATFEAILKQPTAVTV